MYASSAQQGYVRSPFEALQTRLSTDQTSHSHIVQTRFHRGRNHQV